MVEAEQVVPDEDLPICSGARTDPDGRDCQPRRDLVRDRHRNGLEHDREAAGRLERARVVDEAARLLGGAALGLEPTERGCRLRREADVPHHRDARPDDRRNPRERRSGTLELDGIGAGLLDEPDRVRDRLGVGDLERPEGHVRDHERAV